MSSSDFTVQLSFSKLVELANTVKSLAVLPKVNYGANTGCLFKCAFSVKEASVAYISDCKNISSMKRPPTNKLMSQLNKGRYQKYTEGVSSKFCDHESFPLLTKNTYNPHF